MAEISIIIATWNAGKYLPQCLEAIFNQTYRDFEVIIVDNNSTDGSREFIKGKYPTILLVENNNNVGFCRANNQGIAKAKGRYILSLNSDLVLAKDFLLEFKKEIEQSDSRIGMFQSKILKINTKIIDSTGLILSRARKFYNRGEGEIDVGQYDNKREIFGPCAAAALYKREMLEEIKTDNQYFDEDFFFLGEDFDLAWRANNLGWQAIYVPQAVCFHWGHISQHNKAFKQYLSFRNRYYLLIKNESWKTLKNDLHIILSYDLPRIGWLLFTNWYTLKAIIEILAKISKVYREGKVKSETGGNQ